MKVFYILAHPREDSLNAYFFSKGIKQLLQSKHEVQTSDLYKMQFNPSANWGDFTTIAKKCSNQYSLAQKEAIENNALSLDIQQEQTKLLWSQMVIFQFPLWWFSAPAILKGWFDRVFAKGFAYDTGKWFDDSPLAGRKAWIVTTTQSPESSFSENGLHGSIHTVLRPIHHTLRFVGFTVCKPFSAFAVMNKTRKELNHLLEQYCDHLDKIEFLEILSFPHISEFDEKLQRR